MRLYVIAPQPITFALNKGMFKVCVVYPNWTGTDLVSYQSPPVVDVGLVNYTAVTSPQFGLGHDARTMVFHPLYAPFVYIDVTDGGKAPTTVVVGRTISPIS